MWLLKLRWHTISHCVLVILICSITTFTPSNGNELGPPIEGLQPSFDAQCGPLCLYAVTKIMGLKTDYVTLLKATKCTNKGTSLRDLKLACSRYGLVGTPLSINRAKLDRALRLHNQRIAAICYVGGGHFVLYYSDAATRLICFDPRSPGTAQSDISVKALAGYNGKALLISDRPLDPEIMAGRLDGFSVLGMMMVLILLAILWVMLGWWSYGAVLTRKRLRQVL
ncbi:cysteine peptidase family C39 domain-containing protein [Singulisphaera acidiphila]|uniref:ABC-type bacteriocin/lantibiotic exporter with N-terminal double-glycine peptidase domain n=1 Tax=Singulisphaera acidiphila (strain ATCC BAA-1392 / DSM 18658 / VKM B-2454 / MOB10) TaxID=886293 RepID=L0DM61_SINAD|nr:cysteine peptidase family C39 domain-containing protein [Singulisphaera acidiphila]AGA30347.1 ABC-type bacteriocin/lantibiotic exporter with N-terminal double-glycine peptidase domain [Singulisphaera acidiphila DSM 18658]